MPESRTAISDDETDALRAVKLNGGMTPVFEWKITFKALADRGFLVMTITYLGLPTYRITKAGSSALSDSEAKITGTSDA